MDLKFHHTKRSDIKSLDPEDQDMKFLDEYRKFKVSQCLNLTIIKDIRVSVHRLLNKDQKFLMSILKMV